jgi:hypothetical protein
MVTVGIVSMQHHPPDLQGWLEHHKSIGIREVYLRMEGTLSDDDVRTLQTNADWVHVIEHEPLYEGFVDDTPMRTIARQERFVNSVIARVATTTWIIHIDDDELLHCSGDISNVFKDVWVGADTKTVRIENIEAIWDDSQSPIERLFESSDKVLFRVPIAAYGNGKSAARINSGNIARGAHSFAGTPVFSMSQWSLVVLHFDVLSPSKWISKFNRRKSVSSFELSKLPFQYYKDSMMVNRADDISPFIKWRTLSGHVAQGYSALTLRKILFDYRKYATDETGASSHKNEEMVTTNNQEWTVKALAEEEEEVVGNHQTQPPLLQEPISLYEELPEVEELSEYRSELMKSSPLSERPGKLQRKSYPKIGLGLSSSVGGRRKQPPRLGLK